MADFALCPPGSSVLHTTDAGFTYQYQPYSSLHDQNLFCVDHPLSPQGSLPSSSSRTSNLYPLYSDPQDPHHSYQTLSSLTTILGDLSSTPLPLSSTPSPILLAIDLNLDLTLVWRNHFILYDPETKTLYTFSLPQTLDPFYDLASLKPLDGEPLWIPTTWITSPPLVLPARLLEHVASSIESFSDFTSLQDDAFDSDDADDFTVVTSSIKPPTPADRQTLTHHYRGPHSSSYLPSLTQEVMTPANFAEFQYLLDHIPTTRAAATLALQPIKKHKRYRNVISLLHRIKSLDALFPSRLSDVFLHVTDDGPYFGLYSTVLNFSFKHLLNLFHGVAPPNVEAFKSFLTHLETMGSAPGDSRRGVNPIPPVSYDFLRNISRLPPFDLTTARFPMPVSSLAATPSYAEALASELSNLTICKSPLLQAPFFKTNDHDNVPSPITALFAPLETHFRTQGILNYTSLALWTANLISSTIAFVSSTDTTPKVAAGTSIVTAIAGCVVAVFAACNVTPSFSHTEIISAVESWLSLNDLQEIIVPTTPNPVTTRLPDATVIQLSADHDSEWYKNPRFILSKSILLIASAVALIATKGDISKMKTFITFSTFKKAVKDTAEEASDLATFICEEVFGLPMDVNTATIDSLRSKYARLTEISLFDKSAFTQSPMLVDEMDILYRDCLKLANSLRSTARSTYINTFTSDVLQRLPLLSNTLEEFKRHVQATSTRVEPVLILLHGAPGTGKTRLVSYLASQLAPVLGLRDSVYDLSSSSSSFRLPYQNQDFAVIDEYLARKDEDTNVIELNQLISDKFYNFEAPFAKWQPCQVKIIFAIANTPFADLSRKLSPGAIEAYWSRHVLNWHVSFPGMGENRYDISNRREDFSHLQLTLEKRRYTHGSWPVQSSRISSIPHLIDLVSEAYFHKHAQFSSKTNNDIVPPGTPKFDSIDWDEVAPVQALNNAALTAPRGLRPKPEPGAAFTAYVQENAGPPPPVQQLIPPIDERPCLPLEQPVVALEARAHQVTFTFPDTNNAPFSHTITPNSIWIDVFAALSTRGHDAFTLWHNGTQITDFNIPPARVLTTDSCQLYPSSNSRSHTFTKHLTVRYREEDGNPFLTQDLDSGACIRAPASPYSQNKTCRHFTTVLHNPQLKCCFLVHSIYRFDADLINALGCGETTVAGMSVPTTDFVPCDRENRPLHNPLVCSCSTSGNHAGDTQGIHIYGPTRTGKSYGASIMARDLHARTGWPVLTYERVLLNSAVAIPILNKEPAIVVLNDFLPSNEKDYNLIYDNLHPHSFLITTSNLDFPSRGWGSYFSTHTTMLTEEASLRRAGITGTLKLRDGRKVHVESSTVLNATAVGMNTVFFQGAKCDYLKLSSMLFDHCIQRHVDTAEIALIETATFPPNNPTVHLRVPNSQRLSAVLSGSIPVLTSLLVKSTSGPEFLRVKNVDLPASVYKHFIVPNVDDFVTAARSFAAIARSISVPGDILIECGDKKVLVQGTKLYADFSGAKYEFSFDESKKEYTFKRDGVPAVVPEKHLVNYYQSRATPEEISLYHAAFAFASHTTYASSPSFLLALNGQMASDAIKSEGFRKAHAFQEGKIFLATPLGKATLAIGGILSIAALSALIYKLCAPSSKPAPVPTPPAPPKPAPPVPFRTGDHTDPSIHLLSERLRSKHKLSNGEATALKAKLREWGGTEWDDELLVANAKHSYSINPSFYDDLSADHMLGPLGPAELIPPIVQKAARNLCAVSCFGCSTRGLFVKDRTILTVSHITAGAASPSSLMISFYAKNSLGKLQIMSFPAHIIYKDEEKDVALLEILDKTCPTFPDITPYFHDQDEQPFVSRFTFLRESSAGNYLTSSARCSLRKYLIDPQLTAGKDLFLADSFTSDIQSGPGDCGFFFYSTDPRHISQPLLGIYTGISARRAVCAAVSRQYIKHHIAHVNDHAYFTTLSHSDNEWMIPDYVLPDLSLNSTATSFIDTNYITEVGTTTSRAMATGNPRKHGYTPTPFSDIISFPNDTRNSPMNISQIPAEVVERLPVSRDGRTRLPLSQIILYDRPTYSLDPAILDPVLEHLKTKLEYLYQPYSSYFHATSWFVAINGYPQNHILRGQIKRIDMASHVGYSMFADKTHKKGDYFCQLPDSEHYTFAPTKQGIMLRDRVEQLWDAICSGLRPMIPLLDALKKELLPTEKVESTGKVRVFSIEDIAVILCARRLFSPLIAAQHAVSRYSHAAVNVDPFKDFQQLYDDLVSHSPRGREFDATRYDKTIPAQVSKGVFEVYASLYPESLRPAIRVMGKMFYNSLHLTENTLYLVHCGQPSGNLLTSTANSDISYVLVHYVYAANGVDPVLNLEVKTCGDDVVVAESPAAQALSSETLSTTASSFGVTYRLSSSKPIQQLTFLSRTFHIREGTVCPALKTSSLTRQLHWTSRTEPEHFIAIFNGLMHESVLHSPAFFREMYLNICTSILHLSDPTIMCSVDLRRYHPLFAQFLSHTRSLTNTFHSPSPPVRSVVLPDENSLRYIIKCWNAYRASPEAIKADQVVPLPEPTMSANHQTSPSACASYMSLLNEYEQRTGLRVRRSVARVPGTPDHSPEFLAKFSVDIQGKTYASVGTGRSKNAANDHAASVLYPTLPTATATRTLSSLLNNTTLSVSSSNDKFQFRFTDSSGLTTFTLDSFDPTKIRETLNCISSPSPSSSADHVGDAVLPTVGDSQGATTIVAGRADQPQLGPNGYAPLQSLMAVEHAPQYPGMGGPIFDLKDAAHERPQLVQQQRISSDLPPSSEVLRVGYDISSLSSYAKQWVKLHSRFDGQVMLHMKLLGSSVWVGELIIGWVPDINKQVFTIADLTQYQFGTLSANSSHVLTMLLGDARKESFFRSIEEFSDLTAPRPGFVVLVLSQLANSVGSTASIGMQVWSQLSPKFYVGAPNTNVTDTDPDSTALIITPADLFDSEFRVITDGTRPIPVPSSYEERCYGENPVPISDYALPCLTKLDEWDTSTRLTSLATAPAYSDVGLGTNSVLQCIPATGTPSSDQALVVEFTQDAPVLFTDNRVETSLTTVDYRVNDTASGPSISYNCRSTGKSDVVNVGLTDYYVLSRQGLPSPLIPDATPVTSNTLVTDTTFYDSNVRITFSPADIGYTTITSAQQTAFAGLPCQPLPPTISLEQKLDSLFSQDTLFDIVNGTTTAGTVLFQKSTKNIVAKAQSYAIVDSLPSTIILANFRPAQANAALSALNVSYTTRVIDVSAAAGFGRMRRRIQPAPTPLRTGDHAAAASMMSTFGPALVSAGSNTAGGFMSGLFDARRSKMHDQRTAESAMKLQENKGHWTLRLQDDAQAQEAQMAQAAFQYAKALQNSGFSQDMTLLQTRADLQLQQETALSAQAYRQKLDYAGLSHPTSHITPITNTVPSSAPTPPVSTAVNSDLQEASPSPKEKQD